MYFALDKGFSSTLETPAIIDDFRVRNHRATIERRFLRPDAGSFAPATATRQSFWSDWFRGVLEPVTGSWFGLIGSGSGSL